MQERTYSLPAHHRDPFDRLLIAQAVIEKLALVVVDRALATNQVRMIW
jgi:PIN domain nuclease of toxin-antitoxin system